MFKWILKLDCLLKTIGSSMASFLQTGNPTPIDGCSYVVEEIIEGATVTVSKCEHCGKYDITWSKEYLPQSVREANSEILTKGKVCGHICGR